MKDYKKIDSENKKNIHTYGVLYVNKNNELYKANEDVVFKHIPDICDSVTFSREPITIDVKPITYNEWYDKDKEKYMEFAKELYEHGTLEEDDFNLLQDSRKLDNHKELEIEKDDIEHWYSLSSFILLYIPYSKKIILFS